MNKTGILITLGIPVLYSIYKFVLFIFINLNPSFTKFITAEITAQINTNIVINLPVKFIEASDDKIFRKLINSSL